MVRDDNFFIGVICGDDVITEQLFGDNLLYNFTCFTPEYHESALTIDSVDLQLGENRANHHTDKYENEGNMPEQPTYTFLDAPSHLHKKSCPSVRPSVGPSVRPSIGLSVHPSVHPSIHPSVLCYFGK